MSKVKTKWAELQPKDGDVILSCGHLRDGHKEHWFNIGDGGIPFTRPDKTQAVAQWVVVCPTCAIAANFDVEKMRLVSDFSWIGDAPFIPAAKD